MRQGFTKEEMETWFIGLALNYITSTERSLNSDLALLIPKPGPLLQHNAGALQFNKPDENRPKTQWHLCLSHL